MTSTSSIPTISLRGLTPELVYSTSQHGKQPDVDSAAAALFSAFEQVGFAQISNFQHLVPQELITALDAASRRFFALSESEKKEIAMAHGGPAWRGSFQVGDELTSAKIDFKEGIYFGTEMEKVSPLCGPNQFPRQVPEMKPLVLQYLDCCKRIGHLLMALVAIGLKLQPMHFVENADSIAFDPTQLFRIFHYPAAMQQQHQQKQQQEADSLGVGVHTDYGLLTILRQDGVGGLQVQDTSADARWVDVPPAADKLIINIGDQLEMLTSGLFRSTPHRVLRPKPRPNGEIPMRISMPYFFDPGLNSRVRPIPLSPDLAAQARESVDRRGKSGFRRWDTKDAVMRLGDGETYGVYLLGKVSKVFPHLFSATVGGGGSKL